MVKSKKVFYGWFIVLAGTLVLSVGIGISTNCFGLFIVPVCEELGFSRAQMGFNQTLIQIGAMVVAFFAGRLFRVFDIKRIMQVGTIVMCVTYFFYSRAQTIAAFYVVSSLIALTHALITVMPFSVIINNWFVKKRGLALGLTFMGSGLGGMVFNALGGQLMGAIGWRGTFLVLNVIMAAIAIPMVFFVIKITPQEMGLQPYGAEEGPQGEQDAEALAQKGYTFAEVIKTPSFWLLIFGLFSIHIAMNTVNTTMLPHFTVLGHSAAFSANAVAVYMAALACGKVLLGTLFDKLGAVKAVLVANSALMLSLISLIFARSMFGVAGAVFSAGMGNAFGTVAVPIIIRSLYGYKDYSTIAGFCIAASSLGGAIGPTFAGYICDLTGQYTLSFQIYLVMCLVMVTVLITTIATTLRKHERLTLSA